MLKICASAVIAVVLSAVLKRRESVISQYIGEITALTIIFSVISSLIPLVNFIRNSVQVQDGERFISSLLSACSIAVICQTVSNLCRSSGENSLASAVELAGNAEIILLSLPYLSEILKAVFGGLGI